MDPKRSRGWHLMKMGLQAASTSREKTDGHFSDSSSSSLGMYDSDADKEYFPDGDSCTDSGESSTSKRGHQNSSCKVKKKKHLVISKQNEVPEIRPSVDFLLQNDLNLSSDESENDHDIGPIPQIENIGECHTGNVLPVTGKQRKVKTRTVIKQPGKKRVRHEDEWLCNVRKQK
ncbi:hypothetical protein J6590_108805 [Homalodisca vitripennis]|nr:hypothetical protein J6590_108805 [Homalodisca vitripennis]